MTISVIIIGQRPYTAGITIADPKDSSLTAISNGTNASPIKKLVKTKNEMNLTVPILLSALQDLTRKENSENSKFKRFNGWYGKVSNSQ